MPIEPMKKWNLNFSGKMKNVNNGTEHDVKVRHCELCKQSHKHLTR